VTVVYWSELSDDERAAVRTEFADELLPFLSPKALTRAPGHPFPVVTDRRIVLLVVLRDRADSPPHYALVEIPESLPRFAMLSAGPRLLPVEETVRANLHLLYPGRIVVGAHAFRLTRSGDLQLDESSAGNFVQAIEEELARRQLGPVVRMEIEAGTPAPLQDMLQRELHFEESERDGGVAAADLYVAGGPVHLGRLRDVTTPLADYPPHPFNSPFLPYRAIADQIDERDVLVHHPTTPSPQASSASSPRPRTIPTSSRSSSRCTARRTLRDRPGVEPRGGGGEGRVGDRRAEGAVR